MIRKTRITRAIETATIMADEWGKYVCEHGQLDDEFMMQSLSRMYARQYYDREWPRVVVPQTDNGRQLLDEAFCGEYDGSYHDQRAFPEVA